MKRLLTVLLTISLMMPVTAFAETNSVNSPEELVKKASAADNTAFFTLDSETELATEELTNEISDILNGGEADKNETAAEVLEDSGYYMTDISDGKVEVVSLYANQRIRLNKSGDIETFGGNAVFYKDHYLITYNSEEETKTAYELLKEEYGEDNVLLDIPVKVDAVGWGTEYMGMDTEQNIVSGKNDVTVAVLDTGINKSHSIFSNTSIKTGYDFINSDDDPSDDNSHGTAVAGIIAESTPSNVSILPVKVMNASGEGSSLDVLYGIEYAVKHDADIINLSLGVYTSTEAEFKQLNSLYNKAMGDAIVVCAAGNESKNLDEDGVYEFPGENSNIICVGAFKSNGEISYFSNYGSAVDFAAPGQSIKVAHYSGAYATASGTSFSAPYISAASALILSENELDRAGVVKELKSISKDMGEEGTDVYFGNGCPIFTTSISIEDASVSGIEDKTYTGNEITQTPTIQLDGKTLTENSDYVLSYENNINAGTAVMTITGKGSYTGSVKVSFTISPKTISPQITLSQYTFIYDGTEKTPNVTVMDGENKIPSTDYTVEYTQGRTEIGTYSVNVSLINNYTGSGSAEFEIVEDGDLSMILSQTSYVYDGTKQVPSVTVFKGDKTIDDYSVTYPSDMVNAGTYTITVKVGNETLKADFTIYPKEITPNIVLSQTKYTYSGQTKTPTVKVTSDDADIKSSDYTVTYDSGRVNAGTYNVTATMKGNYTGTAKTSFEIEPKAISPEVTLSQTAYTYNGKTQTPNVTVTYGTKKLSDYTVIYPQGRTLAGTYTVNVTLKGNYTGTGRATFAIYKASNTLKAYGKTVKYKYSRKKNRKFAITIKNPKGTVTCTKLSGNSKIKVNNSGVVTVKKKLRRGTYTVKINVVAAGDNNYSTESNVITVKVKIK